MDLNTAGSEGVAEARVVTRKFLFEKMQGQEIDNFEKLAFLESYILSQEDYCEDTIKELKHKISHLKSQFKKKWMEAHKKSEQFLKNNDIWLQGTFERSTTGRPTKTFEELSERSKRRKTEEVRTTLDKDLLMCAAQSSLQNSGLRLASNILKDILNRLLLSSDPYISSTRPKHQNRSTQHSKEALELLIASRPSQNDGSMKNYISELYM